MRNISKVTPLSKVTFSLRAKLFLLVLISFGLLVALITFQVHREAHKVASSTIKESLRQSSLILKTTLASRKKDIEEIANNLARDGRIVPFVYAEEAESLQDQCEEFSGSLTFDILLFTNDEGVLLAHSDDPNARGDYIGDSPLFAKALNGNVSYGIVRRKEKLLQLVVVPIHDNVAPDIIRGTVGVAYQLSPELADEIKGLTGSNIGFYRFIPENNTTTGPEEIYSTLERESASDLQQIFHRKRTLWETINNQKNHTEKILLGKEVFQCLFRVFNNSKNQPIGIVVVMESETKLLQPFQTMQKRVVLISCICLLLASFMSSAIAKHIAVPIMQLTAVAKDIEEGNYREESSVAKLRRDEVGVLYRAIYAMGRKLQEKTELENYLADLSESLDGEQGSSLSLKADPEAKTIAKESSDLLSSEKKITFDIIDPEAKTIAKESSDLLSSEKKITFDIIDKRYKIESSLGNGTMGMVFRAKDIELNETVAVKIILNPYLKGGLLEQFKQEIRLARKITHRNILRTHDFGYHQSYHYITMEYVKGYDLGNLITVKGQMQLRMGIILAKQMTSAIAAAHDEGVIHRDIKPQNIMINSRGILKVMDFGLAVQPDAIGADKQDTDDKFSQSAMIGTPYFMSPEQFSGVKVDVRADIYSLGVLLFYMFTAEYPFQGKNIWQLAKKHLHEAPPLLREKRKDAPEALEKIIAKSLAKKREERYSSVKDLADALSAL